MQPLIHISKIIPPQTPQILQRGRLTKCLNQHQDKKLILVLGQAAQGKSTLVVSYVNSCRIPSAWINLEPADTDAVNLFYLLGHALQRALPQIDFAPAMAYPGVTLGPRQEAPLYRDWLLTLLEKIDAPVQVVFDGLDRLTPGASAFRLLQVLLDVMPPQLRVFILSREMPPVDIQKLVESQDLFSLNNADLAFTLGETTRYFHNIRKFRLSPDLLERIQALTEGWIGGLVLFCDSLDWVPEAKRESYVSQELAGKFIWNIFQYFGERILSLLPREVREFLIRSSILEVVEPEFVGEALGLAKPKAILEDLVKRNLFVQSIYDKKKGWSFRYHPLFKEFLQSKFQSLVAQDQQRDSYYQAATLSERRADLETAVRYYLRAQAFDKAVEVLERVGLEMASLGKTAELADWLAALPPELVQQNALLLLYHFIVGRFSGAEEHIISLQQAYLRFAEQHDTKGLLLSLAYLLETVVMRPHPALPLVHSLLAQAEDLLQSEAARQFPLEAAVLWCQLGFALYLRGGSYRKGAWACQNAYLLGRDLGIIPLQINALVHAFGGQAFMGDFHRAEEIARQVEKLLEKHAFPELRALYLLNYCLYQWIKGDLAKASGVLQQVRELTESYGLTFYSHIVLFHDFLLKIYQGEFRAAEEVGTGLANLMFSLGNLFMYGITLFNLGVCHYRQGGYRQARDLLGRAREVLSTPEALSVVHLSGVKTVLSLVAWHLEENGAARQDLDEAHACFQEASGPFLIKESHLALALWEHRQGRSGEAAAHLEAGLKIAQEGGYRTNVLLNQEDLLQVCILALDLDLEGAWDYAARILTTRLADLSGPELTRLSQHPNRRISDKAREISLAVHRAGLPKLRLQTLGGFHLWRGESLVEDSEWGGHQPQLLLKAIVSHGAKEVPREVLMEDLWPEAAPDQTEKSFKVNLHRLRKVLEPGLDKGFGSSYLHLKANFLTLDSELCRIDLNDFLAHCKEGEKKEGQGDLKGAISLYKAARELYGGAFLPEELYHPWVESRREELQGRFIDLLYRLARLYEKQGSILKAIDCYLKVVQTDALAEPAYRGLMLLFSQRGMRNAALLAYRDCRQALQEALSVAPEEATTAIYRKILESAE